MLLNSRRGAPDFDGVALSYKETLYVYTKRRGFCLGSWPNLASHKRDDWTPWRLDALAANHVFTAFQMHYPVPYVPRSGLWCEKTGQAVWLELLTGSLDANDVTRSRFEMQWRAFEQTIPEQVSAAVRHFGCGVTALLRLLAICPEGVVLAQENAAVFYALAHQFNRAATDRALRPEILRLLRGPQRGILEHCGLLGTESARRAFRKLDPKAITFSRLQHLSAALADPLVGRWLPMAPLYPHIIDLVSSRPLWPYLTLELVEEIAHIADHDDHPDFRRITNVFALEDLVGNLRRFQMRVANGAARPRVFRRAREVQEALPTGSDREDFDGAERRGAFPAPPLAGTPDIVPITSMESLATEGRQMRNCAGIISHQAAVRQGRAYFYRAYKPQRCTLRVERTQAKSGREEWTITEIRTLGNGEPGLGTLQAVCDGLGVPAKPAWHPEDCVWNPNPDYACVPRQATTRRPGDLM